MSFPLMIINYFDLIDVPLVPYKADSPPVIDSDTILPQTVSLKTFKAVSRRNSQVVKGLCPIEHTQFPESNSLNFRWQFSQRFAVKESFRLLILETLNHKNNI